MYNKNFKNNNTFNHILYQILYQILYNLFWEENSITKFINFKL